MFLRNGVLVSLLALTTCTTGPRTTPTAVPQPVYQPENLNAAASANERVSGPIGGGQFSPRASASYSAAPPIALNAAQAVPAQGDVSLDFADTDIRTVVDQILGNILHENYTIDPTVKGTATLRTVTPLARDQLIPTLQTLLAQNKAVLVRANGIYRVMPAADASASPALAGGAGLGGATVVPLRYASAAQLATVLQPYATGGGKLIADPGQNALIVAGDPASRDALVNLIQAFDVDALAGQSYELFPVTSGDAKDFAAAFSAALNKTPGTEKSGPITVVPLERINAVLVIAQAQSFLYDAQRVYAVINQVQRETVRSWHVYYVQNGRANDAAYVLQQAFTPDDVTAQPTAQSSGQAPAALNSQSSSESTSGNSAGGITGLGGSSGIGGLAGSTSSAPAQTGGASGGSSAGGSAGQNSTSGASALLGPLTSGAPSASATSEIRIIPDNSNNSIMIYATAQEDDRIDAMLSKIDIAPVEVRIDATIAEVDLNKQLQYGTQFFFKGDLNAVLSNATQTSTASSFVASSLQTAFPGFVLGGSGTDGAPLAISALQAVTKVNVLSSPELMVLDGQQASLQVGDLVPYLSQSSQSTITTGSPVINSIDYRETGVILQVTPHVGADGLVTLDVSQEVSGVQPTVTTTGLDSPTFSERAVTSRVSIQDGQTIGLAGLISDNDSHSNSGIPFIKNIPLLGDLFSTQNNQRTREELLVLITPHVIRTQDEANALTADLREALPDAAAVPAELQYVRPSDAADPDAQLRSRLPP